MIPTYIFNTEQLQQAITACNNNISALDISNFTHDEKERLAAIYTDLKAVYQNRLNSLITPINAKKIEVTFEVVSNE